MPPLKRQHEHAARESRRDFLKALALSLGLGELAACARAPDDPIVPAPRDLDASEDATAFYASVLARDAYAEGVLVKTRFGHPIKIEGNPSHPASLGASGIFAQAAIYDLWDAGRARTVQRQGQASTWAAFAADLAARLQRDGAGVRILSAPSTSPTLARLRTELARKYPAARWHSYCALPRDEVYAATRAAFGRELDPVYDFSKVDLVLALDADFLTALPGALRYARDFSVRREAMPVRLYSAECAPHAASVLADHRFALRPSALQAFARKLFDAITDAATPSDDARVRAIARDLLAHRGAAVVVCGDHLPAETQQLAHALNARLGAIGRTVSFVAPLLDETRQLDSLASLCADLRAGSVETLLILGGNPVYDAPADMQLGALLDRVPWSAHLAARVDETAARCTWQLPLAHELESWGDLRAYDGAASIQQPAIAPLYEGRSAIELIALALGDSRTGFELVRATWHEPIGDADARWERALREGAIADTHAAHVAPENAAAPEVKSPEPPDGNALDVLFHADATVGDGRHAANAWLQELPKPFTQLTWSNALLIAPATAQRFGLSDEDVAEIRAGDVAIDAPVLLLPGHAEDTITLPLGYGRARGAGAATAGGFDAGKLRTRSAFWLTRGTLKKTPATRPLALAQRRTLLQNNGPIRVVDGTTALESPHPQPSLFASSRNPGDYAWAMSINLGACMGCNACTIACQAENNIPSVGEDQVRRGRIMHWLRVDQYVEPAAEPRLHAQPVPCMHCERAPCELVCPVGATVHDREGLNLQVYNRCVGTRFCANNCPYKVRRFNFLQFTTPALRDYANPDVTVRNRGVMEKCTYCIQRIETARIDADKRGARLRDGEVVTACQAACPTHAIVFGDLNDPGSAVSRSKGDARSYALLAELNTAPRTTYLAKRRNPNPEFPA